jgi:hypothetical protein
MRAGPSRRHALAVAEGARHHSGSKTYSGSLMRPHVPFLSSMISRLGVTSAVDVGCGKGVQYRWQDPFHSYQTVEERWGFEVRKYDPCYQPFAAEPTGRYDLVICTHTLALVPLEDHRWFVERLYRLAPFADLYPAIETVFSSRERIGTATITTRHTRRDGCWHSEVAGPR